MDTHHKGNSSGHRRLLAALGLPAAVRAFAQALPTAKPESLGMSTERLAKISSVLQQE